MSDTPRMNAARNAAMEHMTGDVWRVGCDIESELNAANERIKRLEEAGDALCENSNPSRWDSPADAARKLTEQSNWRKAKEAKP